MAKKGQSFTDWCKNKGYESILDCFIGDISENITISDEKTVLTFKCEKCQQIATSTPQTIRDNIEKDNGKLICKNCHRNTKIVKGGKTVQDWLNQNENIEFIGELIEDDINKEINPSTISVNSNKKIAIRCKIHNYIQTGRVQNLCTNRSMYGDKKQMNCCKAKFLFQDWCLLFYEYKFYAYIMTSVERKVKIYTGKQALNYYKDKKDLQTLLINYSKDKCFKCKDDKEFKAIIKNVCKGLSWCDDVDCTRCSNQIKKHNKRFLNSETKIKKFLSVYCKNEETRKHINKKLLYKKGLIKNFYSKNIDSTETLENTINYVLSIDKSLQKDILEILNTAETRKKLIEKNKERDINDIRKYFIKLVRQIIGEESSDSNTEKMKEEYERSSALNLSCCLLIPRNKLKAVKRTYDYLIYLNNTTKDGLKNGILYGRPVNFKRKISNIELKPESEIDDKDIQVEWKEKLYLDLDPVFNGIAKNSFKEIVFKEFEFPEGCLALEEGSFKDCEINGTLIIQPHLLTQMSNINIIKEITIRQINTLSSGRIEKCGKFGINIIKSEKIGVGYVQYNNVFKMSEALRVYEDHLTLYRGEEAGHGFREYEYIDNFEYQKFYGDNPDDMIISILLAKYNVVTVSQVTDALIDIYNEMNN